MKKILVVDDEMELCMALKKNLSALGDFEIHTCNQADAVINQAKEIQPDLILMDIIMPGLSGGKVAQKLRDVPKTKQIPVIFMTGLVDGDDIAEYEIPENAIVIGKPFGIEHLIRIIGSILKLKPAAEKTALKKILVVDDELELCKAAKKNLEGAGPFKVFICTQSDLAVRRAKALQPDLILMDVMMPGQWGTEIAYALRAAPETMQIPIIFMTGLPTETDVSPEQEVVTKEKHIIEKPFGKNQLFLMVQEVLKLQSPEPHP